MYGNVKAMEEQLSWSIEQAFSGSNPDFFQMCYNMPASGCMSKEPATDQ